MYISRAYIKMLLTSLVFVADAVILDIDFNNPPLSGWDIFESDALPSTVEGYGVKAAMFALTGAAMLPVSSISTGTHSKSTLINVWARLVGVLSASLAAWCWLLNATNGEPGPYLATVFPS